MTPPSDALADDRRPPEDGASSGPGVAKDPPEAEASIPREDALRLHSGEIEVEIDWSLISPRPVAPGGAEAGSQASGEGAGAAAGAAAPEGGSGAVEAAASQVASRSSSADDADEPGTPFGPYILQAELGRGGMGIVYMAYQRDLKRHCALKTISMQAGDAEIAERFVREGQSAARLGKHPNIVQVFDAGVVGEVPYIAMEFVIGQGLEKRLKEGPLPVGEALEMGRKLALALDHAHRRDIIHRDLKPANVILDRDGEPHLLDFGLAKDLTSSSQLSAADAIIGTPAYMPPEQAQPGVHPVDRRSDVYSLAATLHHCLSGKPPFKGDTAIDTLVKTILEDPPSLARLHGVDPDVEAILEKAMEKDPQRRYQTALEMADDLSRAIAGEEPRAQPIGRLGRLWRRMRRNRGVVAAIGVLLALTLTATGYLAYLTAEAGQAVLRRNRASAIVGEMYGNEGSLVRMDIYNRVLQADATWEHAYFQLAVAYLDRALELDGIDPDAALDHRRLALDTLEQGLELGLGAVGYFQRGNTYEELQRFPAMMDDFRRAAELEPDSVFGLQAACALALFEARFEDAERYGTLGLAKAPDSDVTYWRRGEALLRMGRYEEAYEDGVRAVELWDIEPEFHLLAARAQRALGDLAGWARHLVEARAFNAQHPLILAELSSDALERGELARARRLADAAVAVDRQRPATAPNDRRPGVYVARARVRLAQGLADEARADLDKALAQSRWDHDARRERAALDPDEAGALPGPEAPDADVLEAGRDALRRGAVGTALAAARRVLAGAPADAAALDLAVRALLVHERTADAERLLADARAPEALALRAWVRSRAGQLGEALADAEAALAGEAQPAHALRVRAQARLRAGQEELALVDVQRVLREDPLDAEALAVKAACLETIRDAVGAREVHALLGWLAAYGDAPKIR